MRTPSLMRQTHQRPALFWLVRVVGAIGLLTVGFLSMRGTYPMPPQPSAAPLPDLPGQQVWRDGVSSFLFGTNDSYEWSPRNLETDPAMQDALRAAGFTLLRTFIPDNAGDDVIDQRVRTVERTGARCLAVLTNPRNGTFLRHVVDYLGNRCLLYEFGNEPDTTSLTSDEYVRLWSATIPALRALNPRARFIGPATSTDLGKNDYMRAFLRGVAASGVLPDAVSFHWYPCWQESRASCLAKAGSFAQVAHGVRALTKELLGKPVPVGISEWNYDPNNPPPAYGDDSAFITSFTQTALAAMKDAGLAFACQFDAASYGGYGRLDLIDVANGQPKPQYTALRDLIARYRPQPRTSDGPLLSRGKPVVCSANNVNAGGDGAIVSGRYGAWSFWRAGTSALPAWCAIRIGSGPSSILVAWMSDYIFDYISEEGMEPQAYTLDVSADSTNGTDGSWRTLVRVTDNHARAREHLLPFTGDVWLRMTVTQGQPRPTQPAVTIDQIDVYDASAGTPDTFAFVGDSVTVMAYNRFAEHQPDFASLAHAAHPDRFPLMLDEGFGGWTSDGGVGELPELLRLNPDVRYWLLGWGTNDALDNVSPADFAAHLRAMVTAIQRDGRVPILAHIPYIKRSGADAARVDAEVRALNAEIDAVTREFRLTPGPDLYTLVAAHPTYLLDDGIHPSPAGAIAMNRAWYDALAPLFT